MKEGQAHAQESWIWVACVCSEEDHCQEAQYIYFYTGTKGARLLYTAEEGDPVS